VNNADHNRSDSCNRYVVLADEKLIAFGELEAEISHAQRSEEPIAVYQARPYRLRSYIRLFGSANKFAVDYVIRRFNLPSARLNKPQGLDLH